VTPHSHQIEIEIESATQPPLAAHADPERVRAVGKTVGPVRAGVSRTQRDRTRDLSATQPRRRALQRVEQRELHVIAECVGDICPGRQAMRGNHTEIAMRVPVAVHFQMCLH
jgi:hypothetical protein